MATNGGSPQGPSPLLSKPSRPSFGKRQEKNDDVAHAAGVVVASGIAWSLFRSVTGFGRSLETSATLSKEVKLAVEREVKEGEEKAVISAGTKSTKTGKKKAKGKKVQVKDGDTLWGIARKHNVSVSALMASNGIRDGDTISAGEFIVIPKGKDQLK